MVNINCLRCTDLVGKVGKGTNDRINDYNTPYGTQNLEKLTWECPSSVVALQLEKLVLDILEMRGWLLPHQASGKRAEVVAFRFKSKTLSHMIQEYRSNMQWIESLITFYHSKIYNASWSSIMDTVSRSHQIISHGSMDVAHREQLHTILHTLGGSTLDSNLYTLFQRSMTFKAKDHNRPHLLFLEDKHSTCSIL